MDISVIVPIYGVEKYIKKSIRSLFSQTKTQGVEFILVNDCTRDSSMDIVSEVLKDFPDIDVKIIENKQNYGVAVTRQAGLDKAIGDYVIQIDPDDWVEPDMLEKLYSTAILNEADIVSCDYFTNKGDVEQYRKQFVAKDNITSVKLFLANRINGYLWNKFIRRELFVENNVRFVEGINFCEDLLVSIKLFVFTKKIFYLPTAFVHYNIHSGSLTNSATKEVWNDVKKLMQELDVFIREQNLSSKLRLAWLCKRIQIKFYFKEQMPDTSLMYKIELFLILFQLYVCKAICKLISIFLEKFDR